jgi:membrane protein involved in colicin uptake
MGLVLLMGLGLAGWLSWQAWDQPPAARTVAADSAQSAVPSTTVKVPDIDPLTEENTDNPAQRRDAERLERERLAEQREAERLEQERLAAEKRLAEQREVERLERERLAAEKRLAELREAERLERERLAAEKRLVAEREAKRAAALAAWKKANSGIGWAEEIEDGDDEVE